MNKIKLLKLDTMKSGIIRLQSQLLVGKNTADFILEDGILKNWSHGNKGFGFYVIDIPYEIIHNVKDMVSQEL